MYIKEENFLEKLRNKNEKALEYIIDEYGLVISSIVCKKLLFPLQQHQMRSSKKVVSVIPKPST